MSKFCRRIRVRYRRFWRNLNLVRKLRELRQQLSTVERMLRDNTNQTLATHNRISALGDFVQRSSDTPETVCFRTLEGIDKKCEEIKQRLEGLTEKLGEVKQYAPVQPTLENDVPCDTSYLKSLQDKVSKMEQDTYLKFMRKYVLDSQIRLYQQVAQRLYDLGDDSELSKVLTLIKGILSEIGVSAYETKPGVVFDPSCMQPSLKESLYTDDPSLNRYVAKSVSPCFVWDVDVAGRDACRHILKKEEVVLWKYTDEVELIAAQKNASPATAYAAEVVPTETTMEVFAPVAYLVLSIDDEISCVYPVFVGRNCFGSAPSIKDGVHVQKIKVLCSALQPEHFVIDYDENTLSVVASFVAEEGTINGKHTEMSELSTGDLIEISNLKFTFIET